MLAVRKSILAGLLGLNVSVACWAGEEIRTTLGERNSIYPDFIGVNANLTSMDAPWKNTKLVDVTKKLGAANLRYPGGTIGNTWDWSIGWIDQQVAESDLIRWVAENKIQADTNRYTLEDLALGVRETGATPVFMLNMLTKDLQHSIDALKQARALGLEVKYVELGNELYFNLPLEMRIYPTAEDLGKTSKVWIDALRKEFPEAKFAVVGTTILRRERHQDWNAKVLKHADNADAITLHMYTPFSLFGEQERKDFTAGSEGQVDQASGNGDSLAQRQKRELEAVVKEPYFVNMLTNVVEKSREIQKMNVPEDMDIWVTEFNLRGDESAIRGTWANSLVVSVFYDEFLKSGQVKLSNIHNLIGSTWPMTYQDDPLAHVSDPTVHRKPWSVSAGGLTTQYFADAMGGKTAAEPIQFEGASPLLDRQGRTHRSLVGYVFSGDEGKSGILINYSGSNQTVDLGFSEGAEVSFKQTAAPLTHYVMDEDGMSIHRGAAIGQLSLAPYSITTFSYAMAKIDGNKTDEN